MSFLQRLAVLLRSKKTSWIGVISLVLGVLVAFGIIDLEGKEAIEGAADSVIEGGASAAEAIEGIIVALMGLGFIFAKDGDKSTEDVV